MKAPLMRRDQPRVAVIGDHMLDAYVDGTVTRVCPDAPAPVLDASSERWSPGGAANVAMGFTAHGLEVVAAGFIGRDRAGRTLETLLAEAGVSLDGLVPITGRPTLVKRRFCADETVLLRVDEGSVDPVSDDHIAGLPRVLQRADAILVSDYGYGTMTPAVRVNIMEATRDSALLIVDAKDLGSYRALRPDVVKPNYQQFTGLFGDEARTDRVTHVEERAGDVLDITGSRRAVVTLDSDGSVVIDGSLTRHIAAPPSGVRSTSGAGDTFLVALASALLFGQNFESAAASATRAATLACRHAGTVSAASPVADQLSDDRGKRVPPERVGEWAEAVRASGRRVVVTNGCFDIFHAGHAEFLRRAAQTGDALLVAVNTDDGVRGLKGPDRPVNRLEDRLRVLEAIGVVNAVTWFGDPTAEGIVGAARPDSYVKGSDYRGATFPEAELVSSYGGRVHFVDLLEGRSTTSIIKRVQSDTAS